MELRDCRTLIVFGGTFDPPHLAHVALPELARRGIGADGVAYVPAAVSPFKRGTEGTPAEHRVAMLRLALADSPNAAIILDEIERGRDGRPSYTVDTLEALRARLGDGVTLRLLIGADQFRLFPKWKSWERIVTLAEPVVMVRPPDTRAALLEGLPVPLRREEWAPRLLDLPAMDVSSTEIRRRVAAGEAIKGLVAPDVERYIRQHGLYARI